MLPPLSPLKDRGPRHPHVAGRLLGAESNVSKQHAQQELPALFVSKSNAGISPLQTGLHLERVSPVSSKSRRTHTGLAAVRKRTEHAGVEQVCLRDRCAQAPPLSLVWPRPLSLVQSLLPAPPPRCEVAIAPQGPPFWGSPFFSVTPSLPRVPVKSTFSLVTVSFSSVLCPFRAQSSGTEPRRGGQRASLPSCLFFLPSSTPRQLGNSLCSCRKPNGTHLLSKKCVYAPLLTF